MVYRRVWLAYGRVWLVCRRVWMILFDIIFIAWERVRFSSGHTGGCRRGVW